MHNTVIFVSIYQFIENRIESHTKMRKNLIGLEEDFLGQVLRKIKINLPSSKIF